MLLELADKNTPQPLSISLDGTVLLIREHNSVYQYSIVTKTRMRITEDPDSFIAKLFDWSPDGRYVTFEMDRGIWVYDFVDEKLKRITTTYYVTPKWSPKGDLIAFSKALDWDICLSRPDGSDMHKIVDKGSSVVWLLDTNRICYVWNGELYIYNITSDKIRKTITVNKHGSTEFSVDNSFSASPKENIVAYALKTITMPEEYSDSVDKLSNIDIYYHDLTTDAFKNLTNTQDILESDPSWSSDGKKILCFAYYVAEIGEKPRMTPFVIELE